MLLKRLRLTLEMIKFEHSVFALPFALTGALLAFRQQGFHARSGAVKLAWIVVAMVAARSDAMAFNRLVDADLEARNPRTRMRPRPAGARFTRGIRRRSRRPLPVRRRALNRLVDADVDARNPRTRMRHLPAGL